MRHRNQWMMTGALALAILVAPASVSAQSENAQSSDIGRAGGNSARPLAGMDDAQILSFIELLSNNSELQAVIAPIIDAEFEPGEAVPGWRESGINVRAETGADGGLAGKLLRVDDPRAIQIVDLSGTVAPDLTGFTSLRLRAAPPGGANELGFASFAPGVWITIESQHIERRNALCYKGLNGVILHSRAPISSWDENTIYIVAAITAAFDRMAAREFCVVYEREGDAYSGRSFLPDGRRLPQMDAETSLMATMPAAGLSDFMRDAVPALPAAPAE